MSLLPLKVALLGGESLGACRSKRRGSPLPGVTGDTMDATLMWLFAGEIKGGGTRLVDVGEGVLSVGEGWKLEPVGLNTLTPMHDAVEVSKKGRC